MRTVRALATVLALSWMAQGLHAAQVSKPEGLDREALLKERRRIQSKINRIRARLRRENEEIAALAQKIKALQEELEKKMLEASPELAKLVQLRAEINALLHPPKESKGRKGGAKRGKLGRPKGK